MSSNASLENRQPRPCQQPVDIICCLFRILIKSARCIGYLRWMDWENPATDTIMETSFHTILALSYILRQEGPRILILSSQTSNNSSLLLPTFYFWFEQLSRSLLWWQRVRSRPQSIVSTRAGLAISCLFIRYVFRKYKYMHLNNQGFYTLQCILRK